jgi:hypothetical protein
MTMFYNAGFNQNPYANQLNELKRQIENLQNTTVPQPVQPIQPVQLQPVPQIPTVHGYEGIKSFFVPPSGSAVALDADSSDDKLIVYVKMVDSNGIATIKAYDAYERQEATKETESQYVLKSDFDKLVNQLKELTNKLNTPVVEVVEKEPAVKKGGRSS